jgi:hypothetical protein
MPILRYFVVVGAVLLGLMLVADRYFALPPVAEVAATASPLDRSILRIHSDQKLPERIVFDTTLTAPARTSPVVASTASVVTASNVKPVDSKVDPKLAFAAMEPQVAPKAAPHTPGTRVKPERRARQRLARQPRSSAIASVQPGSSQGPWSWSW